MENLLSESRRKVFDEVDQMLARFDKILPRTHGAFRHEVVMPFYIGPPAMNSSKEGFQFECDAIKDCLASLKSASDAVSPAKNFSGREGHWWNFQVHVDEKFRRNQMVHTTDSPQDLIQNNIAIVGGLESSLATIQALQSALTDRQKDLEKEKELFWNLGHRAPNYHARAIALRLAKLYANETGERPTHGTSPDTGKPNTAFTQALSEIFKIIGIEGNERTYAKWAIGKLTSDDLDSEVPIRNFDFRLKTFDYLNGLDEIDLLTDRA